MEGIVVTTNAIITIMLIHFRILILYNVVLKFLKIKGAIGMISLYNSIFLMNKPIIVPETTEASSYYEGMVD